MDDISDDQGVKFVRLKNGDDVISQVVEFSDDNIITYALIQPLKIVYIPSTKGTAYLQVAFMPWVFTRICEEQEFMIHAEDIMTMGRVSEKMEEYYWSNLDHFTGKEEPVEEIDSTEEDSSEELDLEKLLEAVKNSRRTYH